MIVCLSFSIDSLPEYKETGDIDMDYKKKIIEMLEKADHDQTYTIFRFVCSFLGIK